MMVSDAEKAIINSPQKKYIYQLDWLSPQEEVIGNVMVDLISGSANFDATNNNRRSCSLTLRNLNKQYIPSPDSTMWINNKVKLKCIYELIDGTQSQSYNQGVYVLGNPQLLSTPTQKEVSLQLLDKWTLLDGTISGKLKNKYKITLGSRIDNLVRSIMTDLAGETKLTIDDCSITTPYTVEKTAGSTVADIILELCQITSYEAFYDNNGYFVFRKALTSDNIDSTPPSWNYTTSGLYLQSTRTLDWNAVRNSVTVWGMYNTNTGEQYYATSADSTGSDLSIDKIGERPEVLEDDKIYSNDLCKQRSDYELLRIIKANEKVSVSLIPNFSHELNEVISLVDENNGCSGNYLIQSISYNLSYDTTMSLTLWKVRDIR